MDTKMTMLYLQWIQDNKDKWLNKYEQLIEKDLIARNEISNFFEKKYNVGSITNNNLTNKIVDFAFKNEIKYLKNLLKKTGFWWEIKFRQSLNNEWEKKLKSDLMKLQNSLSSVHIFKEIQDKIITSIHISDIKIKKNDIEEGIDSLEYFKREINSIDLQNQPSTSGYKPNSPQI